MLRLGLASDQNILGVYGGGSILGIDSVRNYFQEEVNLKSNLVIYKTS